MSGNFSDLLQSIKFRLRRARLRNCPSALLRGWPSRNSPLSPPPRRDRPPENITAPLLPDMSRCHSFLLGFTSWSRQRRSFHHAVHPPESTEYQTGSFGRRQFPNRKIIARSSHCRTRTICGRRTAARINEWYLVHACHRAYLLNKKKKKKREQESKPTT